MYETLGGYSDVCYNAKTGTAFVAYEYDDYRDLRVSEISAGRVQFTGGQCMKLLNTALIERAGENGYPFYRIPASWPPKRARCSPVTKRATAATGPSSICTSPLDGRPGNTWEARQMVLYGQKKNTTNNPVMIVDGAARASAVP